MGSLRWSVRGCSIVLDMAVGMSGGDEEGGDLRNTIQNLQGPGPVNAKRERHARKGRCGRQQG